MIKVVVDRPRAMVALTAEGYVAQADVMTAAGQLHAAIRSLGERAGKHLTLYDLSDAKVAAGPALEAFAAFFTDPRYRPIWARRVAFVTTSTLLTRQMARIRLDRPDMEVFDTRAKAIAWLLEAREQEVAA